MKHKLPFLFFLMISASAFSQASFGIKTGLNISNAEYNINNASPEGLTGFFVGTLVDFNLFPDFHVQPEVSYSREGVKDGSIDFLNISVTLKWYFFEGIHVNTGPQLGVVLDAEGGTNGLNSMNVSGVLGLGYETPGGFMIDTRFVQGVTSIIDEDFHVDSGMGYDIVGIKAWARTIQIGIGYKF